MEEHIVSIAIILICIVMSGYFSATETAFSSCNKVRLKNMADKGNKRAKLVLQLSDNFDSLLSTILIGNNIVNILCSSLATVVFIALCGEDLGAVLSTVVITIVVLIFGEISPKSIAKESPESFAMFSAPILRVIKFVLTPFNFLFGLWKKLLTLIFKPKGDNKITEEELLTYVDEAEQGGSIDEQVSDLLHNVIDFSALVVEDIVTPRVDITALPLQATLQEAYSVFAETGYSRIPLYEESIDKIVGVLYQKDIFVHLAKADETVTIQELKRDICFTTRGKKIKELMQEMQNTQVQMCVVLDEFGGTMGIVTLEDIIEEFVGDIWDEHDEVEHWVVDTPEGKQVKGNTSVDYFSECLGIDIADTTALTVSGWVLENTQRIPKKDEEIEIGTLSVKIVEMSKNRIRQVLVNVRTNGTDATSKVTA